MTYGIDAAELDAWITGNGGEDRFGDEEPDDEDTDALMDAREVE